MEVSYKQQGHKQLEVSEWCFSNCGNQARDPHIENSSTADSHRLIYVTQRFSPERLKKHAAKRLNHSSFLSHLPFKLSINKCNSSYKWGLGGCCQDLQHPQPYMPPSVCDVGNGPARMNVCIPCGWYDSCPGSICSTCLRVDKRLHSLTVFYDWLIEGNLPPRPLLICCCRAAVRHSPGCNPDSTALLLWGRQRSAAAGCLPVSQQYTHTHTDTYKLLDISETLWATAICMYHITIWEASSLS